MDLLRNENGRIWAYSRKRSGAVSKSGTQVSAAEAASRVAAGEAEWDASRCEKPSSNRESYADHVRDLADRNPAAVQPRDWSIAMNRDD